jgi:hypothetical protein
MTQPNLGIYWYVKQKSNTLWCLMPGNYSPNEHPDMQRVAVLRDQETAQYIARMHNQALHDRKRREDPEHDQYCPCFCCCFDCPDDLDK